MMCVFSLGIAGVAALIPCVFCLHIVLLSPADSHTLASLLEQYKNEFIRKRWVAMKIRYNMWKATKNPQKCQQKVLMSILKEQAQTEYGKIYHFGEIKTREEFVRVHPLNNYDDLEEYIEWISKGEENILTKRKVQYLSMSSGTNGKTKMFPVTKSPEMDMMIKLFTGRTNMHRQFYGPAGMKRIFDLRIFHTDKRSPCGLKMGSLSAHVWKPTGYNLLPNAVSEVYRTEAAFYVQSIFALADKEIGLIVGFSSDLLLAFFKFMDNNYEKLCEDIERGEIRPIANVSDDLRARLNMSLKPLPIRSAEIRRVFQTRLVGRAKKLWPDLGAASLCKTGSFVHSATLLQESYMDGVLMNFIIHGGSEGYYALMMEEDADKTIYTAIPNLHFLEFIPLADTEQVKPSTLFMEQVNS